MTAWDAGQRPPVSFWLAVSSYGLLCTGIPMCLGMVSAALSHWGLNAFITGLFVAIGFTLAMSLPFALGFRTQRAWWRRWVLVAGGALLAGWFITLLIALSYPLGLTSLYPGADPGFGSMAWTGLVILLALTLPAYWLLRTLRDPYWRAGTV